MPAKATSKSSRRWLDEHFKDKYVKQAQAQGLRSRAAFKLLEILDKDQLLKPGMIVVDLGAAPGGWSEIAAKRVSPGGKVFATDRLPMEPIRGVHFVQGDFSEPELLKTIQRQVGKHSVDLVMSDMAPNLSGVKAIDQPRMMNLAEFAFDFAQAVLKPGGNFLVKLFQGEGFQTYCQTLRNVFKRVVVRKPKASRARSAELYVLAKEFLIK